MADMAEVKQRVGAGIMQAQQASATARMERESLENLSLSDIQTTLGDVIAKLAGVYVEGYVQGTGLSQSMQLNRAIKNRSDEGAAEVFNAFGPASEANNRYAEGMLAIGEGADHQQALLAAMGRSVVNAVTALRAVQNELVNYELFRDGAIADVDKIQQHATNTVEHADNYLVRH